MSVKGRGSLWFLPKNETINANKYLEVLKEKLPIFMPILNCKIFQHDGAPAHRAKIVSAWLRTNKIDVLPNWPGNSPDINVIENCWSLLKKKVADKHPGSIQELIDAIKLTWTTEITPEYCQQLVKSIPKRLAQIIANKGNPCKY